MRKWSIGVLEYWEKEDVIRRSGQQPE